MATATELRYSSIAVQATLTQAVSASDVVFQVSDTTGWPDVPFKLIVDKDRPAEEVVICTSKSGVTLGVLRGMDNTPAASHDVAAPIIHGYSAQEFQEANDHMLSSADVHGVAGDLVGTDMPQTLDKKTFRSASGSNPPLTVQAATGQSGNIVEIKAETGTVVGSVKPSGRVSTPGVDGSSSSTFTAGSAGTTPVVIQLAAGQSAKALRVLNSAGQEVASISPTGVGIFDTVQVNTGGTLGSTTGTTLTLSGGLTAASLQINGSGNVTGNLSVSGTLSATNLNAGGTLNVSALTASGYLTQRSNVPIPIMAAGMASISISNGSYGATSISFPSGRFSVPPIVMCTLQDSVLNSPRFHPRAVSISTSGCILQVYTGDSSVQTTSVTVGWVAVQMTSGAAEG